MTHSLSPMGATPQSSLPAGFRSLSLRGWRQFELIELEFHDRLTVLTGANATGKSTILGILARHFNWQRSFSAEFDSKTGEKWTIARAPIASSDAQSFNIPWIDIGSLRYVSGASTQIQVPLQQTTNVRFDYQLHLPAQQQIGGTFLTSHRAVSGNYVPVSSIPTRFGTPEEIFNEFTEQLKVRWANGWSGKSPQQSLKEALMAAAVFSRGTEFVDANPIAAAVWDGFQRVLKDVLPTSLGFRKMRVRIPEIMVETEAGEFVLDDASGGLSAVIELAWQIFLRSRDKESFTVLMDEPENHLHPSLQREILPSLMRAFPHVQFIVATHSPFVVTASSDSAVYALDYDSSHRVVSRLLDYTNKAASADETLRNILGVPSTMPAWAESAFERIVGEYSVEPLTNDRVRQLRTELEEFGLIGEFPGAIVRIADGEAGEPLEQ